MKLQFFKPNPRGTGHACSFNVQTKAEDETGRKVRGVYLEIIKQTSWDNSAKTGSFKDGQKINIKFSKTEAAGLLDAIERVTTAKMFHSSGDKTTSIEFTPWMDGENYKGFGFAILQNKVSYRVGLTPAEVTELREWLKFSLHRTFTAMYNDLKKSRANA